MARPRNKVLDYLVYLVVRVAVCVIQALTYRAGCRLAAGLAWLAYRLDRRHRLVAMDNLAHAFPDLDERQRDALVRAVYLHFCTVLIEIVHIPRVLFYYTWRKYLALGDGDRIIGALLSDRPVMIVTGHLGNWEIAGYANALLGFHTHAIARTLDNPYLDRYLLRFRERTGQRVLDKERDWKLIQGVMADKGILATLADQDAGQKGAFVDYFGRPASTHRAVALLALEYDVLLLVTGTCRTRPGLFYEVKAADLIDPREYAERPDAVKAMTQRFTAALEGLARQHPDQYFWLHRRWKHQPQARKAKKAAA